MEETERSLHDAIMIVRRAIKVGKALASFALDYNCRFCFVLLFFLNENCPEVLIKKERMKLE